VKALIEAANAPNLRVATEQWSLELRR